MRGRSGTSTKQAQKCRSKFQDLRWNFAGNKLGGNMQTMKETPQRLTDTSTVAGRRWHCLISLSAQIVVLLLTWSALALPSYAQITPSDDAYVLAANPTTRYGGAATLAVQSGSSTAFVRFDLSAIPTGYASANVAKATLKL